MFTATRAQVAPIDCSLQSIWQSRLVWGILTASLTLRILMVMYITPRQTWTGDPARYLQWGVDLARNGKYLQDPIHNKMPGMAALVAVGCLMGESGCIYFPLVLFAMCGTAAGAGLWWLLLPTLRPAARIPALLLLQFGVFELVIFTFRLLPDLPALALGIGAICSLVVARQSSYWLLSSWLGGILFGAALYLRPDYVPVIFSVVLIWVVGGYREIGIRKVIIGTLSVVLAASLCVVPWGVRNHRLSGEFRIFSDQGNRVLWWAFNDHRNLDWNQGVLNSPSQLGTMWNQDGDVALSEAKQWALAHPVDSIFLMASRIVSHIRPMPPTLVIAAATQIPVRSLRWAFRGMVIVVHESWMVTGLIALVLGLRRLPLGLLLLAAFAGTRILFPGAFIPDGGRYALIFVPFLSFCAIWFFGGSEQVSARRSWLAIAIAVFAIQAWFVFQWGLWG